MARKRTSDDSTRVNRRKEKEQNAKHWAREWLDAFLFAAIAALILRMFFFGAYRIPTPSMEKTLLTGDFLLVSKLSYGPRTPMTVSIPFTDVFIPGLSLPYYRMPGFDEVERNDIIVFNYPIDSGPVPTKTNYIKRAVGMPGDRIEIREKQLLINEEPEVREETYMQHYRVMTRESLRLSATKVRDVGGDVVQMGGENLYILNLTDALAEEIAGWNEIESVESLILPPDYQQFSRRPFNFSSAFVNHDHMGPFTVPYEGQEVVLTEENWPIYQDIIERYEGNSVQFNDGEFMINGERTNRYTIRMDYFFAMGDNRDDSEDSRYWGFVPENHLIGKASLIYFSWDGERWLPRFGRLLNLIHD